MYTPAVMERNLGVGNIGEACFRAWYDRRVAGVAPAATLEHYGYNPDGIVVGRDKVEMLKALTKSPDYVLLSSKPGSVRVPLLGISVNGQSSRYTMHDARAPWLCYVCARKAQQRCFDKEIGNLWFNRYNIENDYRGFVAAFGVDVILVTIEAGWFGRIFKQVKDEGLESVALRYIRNGQPAIGDGVQEGQGEMQRFLSLVTKERRGTKDRRIKIEWLSYQSILNGEVAFSIAGGQSQFGRPREVVCIDSSTAQSEDSLVRILQSPIPHLVKLRGGEAAP
ncbi:MAG TPA: hypothetical protein VML94_07990 [Thermoplasmata archaeon]|nr:hypothetical protein [Thermoplasmata archaeon]